MAIARWAVDRHAGVHQRLAKRVNVIDRIGEMAKIAATVIIFRGATVFGRPVLGQFNFSHILLPRRSQKNQGKAARFYLVAPHFFQTKQVEERHAGIGIADPQHGVKIFYRRCPTPFIAIQKRFIAHTAQRNRVV